jgi:hypothetical protein
MLQTTPIFVAIAPGIRMSVSAVLDRYAQERWLLLGVIAAAGMLGSFVIRRRSIPLLAVRTACAAGLAVYGFGSGVWPLGIVLAVVCARHGYELRGIIPSPRGTWGRRPASRYPLESRISRMFDVGSSLADWDARPTEPKSPHDTPPPEGAMN